MTCESGPTQRDLCFKQYETWSMVVTCKDGTGGLIDLTGAISANWRVASINVDGTPDELMIDAGIGTGIEISATPTDGVLTISVSEAMQITGAIVPGEYRHELQIVTSSGAPSTQMEGILSVTESLFSHAFA